MQDIFGEESRRFSALEAQAHAVGERYGYEEIRTPLVEPTELFVRSIGEATDIVEKEMFTFTDAADKSLTLRPEGTAGVVRAYLEGNIGARQQLAKFFYLGPMFRREKPQAGRRRQFNQFGTEALGSSNPALDVETIDLMTGYGRSLGLENCELAVNSVGCRKCRPAYIGSLTEYLQKREAAFCGNCRKRIKRNPLRVLDCKNPDCEKLVEAAPRITDNLCSNCAEHFDAVKKYLESISLKFIVSPLLVRGLDYYTGTVFELYSSDLGAQAALGAGGRYDNLVEDLGGDPTGAVGFSIGLERILMLLEGKEIPKVGNDEMKWSIFLAGLGDDAFKMNFVLLARLRRKGYPAGIDYLGRSLKAQMREANRQNTDIVIIRGADEIEKGGVQLKYMATGEESFVADNEIIETLAKRPPVLDLNME